MCLALIPRILCASYVYAHPSPILPVWDVQKFMPQGIATAGYVFPVESSKLDCVLHQRIDILSEGRHWPLLYKQ